MFMFIILHHTLDSKPSLSEMEKLPPVLNAIIAQINFIVCGMCSLRPLLCVKW